MNQWDLTEDDKRTILHSLRVAADKFDANAEAMRDAKHVELEQTFRNYATCARELLAELED